MKIFTFIFLKFIHIYYHNYNWITNKNYIWKFGLEKECFKLLTYFLKFVPRNYLKKEIMHFTVALITMKWNNETYWWGLVWSFTSYTKDIRYVF